MLTHSLKFMNICIFFSKNQKKKIQLYFFFSQKKFTFHSLNFSRVGPGRSNNSFPKRLVFWKLWILKRRSAKISPQTRFYKEITAMCRKNKLSQACRGHWTFPKTYCGVLQTYLVILTGWYDAPPFSATVEWVCVWVCECKFISRGRGVIS